MKHDDMIDLLFREYHRADRKNYVDLFLSGLSHHKMYYGMAALGYMNMFPYHKFCVLKDYVEKNGQEALKKQKELKVTERTVLSFDELSTDLKLKVEQGHDGGCFFPCEICSDYYNVEYYDIEENKEHFWEFGGFPIHNNSRLYWMQYTNSLETIPKPSAQDYEIFQIIINCICSAEFNEGVRDVYKKITQQPFFKSWLSDIRKKKKAANESIQYLSTHVGFMIQQLLEMLGWCGILHTEKHLAPFYEYDNLPMVAGSNWNSDWQLPVDFWRGKDGIDKNAFKYWFDTQTHNFTF